ncbi:hypothetical protein [uncultured Gammaproteobacteria bacterium]|nr:hypothetical protein [uncultured Gammaproteobacteria bacterium]
MTKYAWYSDGFCNKMNIIYSIKSSLSPLFFITTKFIITFFFLIKEKKEIDIQNSLINTLYDYVLCYSFLSFFYFYIN